MPDVAYPLCTDTPHHWVPYVCDTQRRCTAVVAEEAKQEKVADVAAVDTARIESYAFALLPLRSYLLT